MNWSSFWPALLMFGITTVFGIIAFFIKNTLKDFEGKISDITGSLNETKGDVKTLRRDFEQFKQQLPFLYVLREDWIRAQIGIEKKLEEIYKMLLSMTTSKSGG